MAVMRQEVFDKVERAFMLGLRASDPARRRQFFRLFNESVPLTLFHRLKWVVMDQPWEQMSNTFWLKQALVSRLRQALLEFMRRVHAARAMHNVQGPSPLMQSSQVTQRASRRDRLGGRTICCTAAPNATCLSLSGRSGGRL
jgi:hypothetical protein